MEPSDEIRRLRGRFVHTGRVRPPFAVAPAPGQRSVWDFPRPPRIEPLAARVEVELGGTLVASSVAAVEVLETASPPTVYVPPHDVLRSALVASGRVTLCEWKGRARHFGLAVGDRFAADAAWTYDEPFAEFRAIAGWLSFYPSRVDACRIDGELVAPQAGGVYGGWVTRDLAGPFKGEPGTGDW